MTVLLMRDPEQIIEDFQQRMSLRRMTEKYQFRTMAELGEWMAGKGYRWDPKSYTYEKDPFIIQQMDQFDFKQEATVERLSEENVILHLHQQLQIMQELLQGALPIHLSERMQEKLKQHCTEERITPDYFIEQLLRKHFNEIK